MKNFILFFFINVLVHLPFLNLPPCGTHVWRQCNTLAMSRNFTEEGMDILKPRIDRRNDTDGITGSHFPLYEWLLALCSRLFGFSELLARLFSLIIFSFAMYALYRILLHFESTDFVAKTGALLLLALPELYYHSINAMPDVLALCLALFALLYWLMFQKQAGLKTLTLAIFFSMLCGLIKFHFLIIPFSAIAFVPLKFKDLSKYALIWAGITLPVAAWYWYAIQLTKLNNLREFGLWISPISLEEKLQTVTGNVLMDLPEVLFGWPLLIAFVFVFIKAFKFFKRSNFSFFILIWLFSFLFFYWMAIERMHHHAYYFIPFLPLIVIVFIRMASRIELSKGILTGVMVLSFAWCFARIIPSRWLESKWQIAAEFSDPVMRNEFHRTIPANSKCVVGPDISGCIFFYFTHTKGYSFEHPEELIQIKNNRMDIENMRAAGMKYLIFKDGTLLQPLLNTIHLKRKIKTIGAFDIWEL